MAAAIDSDHRQSGMSAARAAMEQLNAAAVGLHIWLRTQANAPAQRPWFHDGGLETGGQLAPTARHNSL